jgi:predicted dehydrogenase
MERPVISVGVAGLGYWGPNLVRNFSACSQTELAWLCDKDPDRLEAIGRQHPSVRRSTKFEEMLADERLDAVAIATPVATHHRLAKAALLARKHVLVEKPLTASVAEAAELVALADEVERVLLVDHIFLYTPSVGKMAELVRTGEVGDLLFFDSVRINLGVFQHDVSVLWDLAPHDLSIIDHLIGREPESVMAIGASRTVDGLEDVVYLHLEYGNGLLASLHLNWLSPVKVRHFLAGGSRRSILYNDLDASERLKVYDRGVDVSSDPAGLRDVLISYRLGDVVSPRLDATEALFRLVEHFADCIERRVAPISGGEQGLRIVRVLAAAQESLSRGSERVRL